jgi:hypothetical protein
MTDIAGGPPITSRGALPETLGALADSSSPMMVASLDRSSPDAWELNSSVALS